MIEKLKKHLFPGDNRKAIKYKEFLDAFDRIPLGERRGALQAWAQHLVPDAYQWRYRNEDISSHEGDKQRRWELDVLFNTQSRGFMCEIIPLMYPHFSQDRDEAKECLDVGTRTGAGASLLAELFMSHFSRTPLFVDTIDLDPTYKDYQLSRWPNLRHALVGDIFDLPIRSYDFVVCSHTIEHLPDPGPFCRRLQQIARECVFLYCPYEEKDCIPDHHCVTDEFIESLCPIDKKIIRSWWCRKNGPPEECVFFVLKGLG